VGWGAARVDRLAQANVCSAVVFQSIWNIKPRLLAHGRVANPRDTTRYRFGLRLGLTQNASRLVVPSRAKNRGSGDLPPLVDDQAHAARGHEVLDVHEDQHPVVDGADASDVLGIDGRVHRWCRLDGVFAQLENVRD
jgi:hypothetical protein